VQLSEEAQIGYLIQVHYHRPAAMRFMGHDDHVILRKYRPEILEGEV